jgi:hypothetical protein
MSVVASTLPPERTTATGPDPGDTSGEKCGETHRAGPFQERLRPLQAENERFADLLVRDLDDALQRVVENRGGQRAPALHGDAVRDREPRPADDADRADGRAAGAKRDGDPRREAAATDRDQHGLGLRRLLGELQADRPLAGDHAWILERVHEGPPGAGHVLRRRGERLLEALAGELDAAAVRARRLDLRHGRVPGLEDRRLDTGLARRPGDRLAGSRRWRRRRPRHAPPSRGWRSCCRRRGS